MAVHDTHDIGSFYWHLMRVPWGTPPAQRGVSYEVEEPWRIGSCWTIRLLVLPVVLVVGWWGAPRTLEEVEAAEEGLDDEPGVDPETIRQNFTAPAPTRRDSPLYDVR